jgi:hypothetical protein
MALGFTFNSGSGGSDIIPIVKFDCRAGRMFRRDRVNGETEQVDITKDFKGVFDFENIEVGTINFDTGTAPDFCLVQYGNPVPPPPTEKHRPGCRVLIKLGKDSGGDLRELASTAKAFLQGIDSAHNAYLAGVQDNPGKLPVVALKDCAAITSGEGAKKSTNYAPVFEIVGWVTRPADLVYKPKNRPVQSTTTPVSPPTTGSTKVSAPSASDGAEDFG